jgi:hypothetical protein
MHDLQKQVDAVVVQHQQKAEQSAYDKNVAIVAVGSAAQLVERFTWSGDDLADLETLVQSLDKLRDGYNDSAGEYTSGKGYSRETL